MERGRRIVDSEHARVAVSFEKRADPTMTDSIMCHGASGIFQIASGFAACSSDLDVVFVVHGGVPSSLVPTNHKYTLFAIGVHPFHKSS